MVFCCGLGVLTEEPPVDRSNVLPTFAITDTPTSVATGTPIPSPTKISTATTMPIITRTETLVPTPLTFSCVCSSDTYNCGDPEVVMCFSVCPSDIHKLDRDNDGIPCENLQ